MLNVRYVDYKLQRSGDYVYKDGSNVHTRNAYVLMDKNFNVKEKKLFDSVFDYSCRIRGVEDVRIVSHGEKIHYMGTYQIPKTFKLCICFGEYNKDKSRLSFNCFESPKNNDCEKNWTLFSHKNDLKFIYHWNPLTIGRIIDASTSEIIVEEEDRQSLNIFAVLPMVAITIMNIGLLHILFIIRNHDTTIIVW